jgi:Leucine-rich repeat (LRR) protein
VGKIPTTFENFKSLAIDLSNNHLSSNIPSSIKNCKSLEELFIANNIFSSPIMNTLREVKGLDTLNLSSNQLFGSILAKLQNLLVLQFLNLSFNHLERVVPKGGFFRDLSKVHLEGNPKLCLHLAYVNSQGRGRKVAIVLVITSVLLTLVLCVILGSLFYITKSKSKITKTSEPLKGKHQMISYNELRKATGNFNQENLLGKRWLWVSVQRLSKARNSCGN